MHQPDLFRQSLTTIKIKPEQCSYSLESKLDNNSIPLKYLKVHGVSNIPDPCIKSMLPLLRQINRKPVSKRDSAGYCTMGQQPTALGAAGEGRDSGDTECTESEPG